MANNLITILLGERGGPDLAEKIQRMFLSVPSEGLANIDFVRDESSSTTVSVDVCGLKAYHGMQALRFLSAYSNSILFSTQLQKPLTVMGNRPADPGGMKDQSRFSRTISAPAAQFSDSVSGPRYNKTKTEFLSEEVTSVGKERMMKSASARYGKTGAPSGGITRAPSLY